MRAVHVVEALSHTDEASLINSFALPRKGLRQRYARDLHALYQGLAPDADADADAHADSDAGADADAHANADARANARANARTHTILHVC